MFCCIASECRLPLCSPRHQTSTSKLATKEANLLPFLSVPSDPLARRCFSRVVLGLASPVAAPDTPCWGSSVPHVQGGAISRGARCHLQGCKGCKVPPQGRGKALAVFPDMARGNLLQIKVAWEGCSKFTLRGRILWEPPEKSY